MKRIIKGVSLIAIVAVISGCSSTAWEKRVLAVGWAEDSTPIVLQWVPTGATIFLGRSFPVMIYASGGHYRMIHGQISKDIDIPEDGMSKIPGAPSYSWFYIVDQNRLLAAGHKYAGGPHHFAVEFDVRNNTVLKEATLKYVRDAPDSILSEDLSYQASPTSNGLIITELATGVDKIVLPGCRVRYVRFSRDGERLAALFMVPDDIAESFPFKAMLARVATHVTDGAQIDSKLVGVAIVSVRNATVVDVKPPESSNTWDFYRHYREYGAFADFTYQQRMTFSFSLDGADLVYMNDPPEIHTDRGDTLFLHGLRAIGPFISADGRRGGFYVLRDKVYWWDINTRQYHETVLQ